MSYSPYIEHEQPSHYNAQSMKAAYALDGHGRKYNGEVLNDSLSMQG